MPAASTSPAIVATGGPDGDRRGGSTGDSAATEGAAEVGTGAARLGELLGAAVGVCRRPAGVPDAGGGRVVLGSPAVRVAEGRALGRAGDRLGTGLAVREARGEGLAAAGRHTVE